MSAPIRIWVHPPLPDMVQFNTSPSAVRSVSSVLVSDHDRRSIFQQVQTTVFPWWIPLRFQDTKGYSTSLEARLWDVFNIYRTETAYEVKTAVVSWGTCDHLIKTMYAASTHGAVTHTIKADGSRATTFCGVTIAPCDKLSDHVVLLYGVTREDLVIGPMRRTLLGLPLEHRLRIQIAQAENLLKSSRLAEKLGVPFALYN